MDKINDGGAAFPLYDSNCAGKMFLAETGIYVRDYFAAKALQGMCVILPKAQKDGSPHDWQSIAVEAYKAADAMILAREQKS